jgi:hypothetical protein
MMSPIGSAVATEAGREVSADTAPAQFNASLRQACVLKSSAVTSVRPGV